MAIAGVAAAAAAAVAAQQQLSESSGGGRCGGSVSLRLQAQHPSNDGASERQRKRN
jgi:hypothetical protein